MTDKTIKNMDNCKNLFLNLKTLSEGTDNLFIVQGDSLIGDINRVIKQNQRTVFLRDDFFFRNFNLSLLENKCVDLENGILNLPWLCEPEEKKYYYNSHIQSLSKIVHSDCKNIYIIEWNSILSDIWRLYIQAFLEEKTKHTKVTVIKFDPFSFEISKTFSLDINGSSRCFYSLCQKIDVNLELYSISKICVDTFLDIISDESSILNDIACNYLMENYDEGYISFMQNKRYRHLGLSADNFKMLCKTLCK